MPHGSIGSPTEVVVEMVNKLGVNKAAPKLGVSPSKLSRWLKTQRYVRKTQYVKEAAPLQTA